MKSVFVFAAIIIAGFGIANDVQGAVGRTEGTFQVSNSGAATYRIPIWVPPGTNGMQPNLSLVYNSRGGGGPIGPGWQLSGLLSITRCARTFAQDPAPAPVQLATTDGYCINGNRLRLTSGAYGASGSTYQTEIDDFSRYTVSGPAGNGPASFTVETKSGLIYEYGVTADSRILASGTSTVREWLLNKVRDRAGNSYSITYGTGQTGSVSVGVPTSIAVTPNNYGATIYSVSFDYGPTNAATAEVGYVSGTLVKNTNQLTAITVRNPSATILRKYILSYQASTSTGRQRLSQVQECAGSAGTECLLPTAVSYQDGQSGLASTATSAGTGATSGNVNAGDFNGDGRGDLIYSVVTSGNARWYVSFANTSGGFNAPRDTGLVTASVPDPILLDDFLGEGQTTVLGIQSGAWHLLRWNTSTSSFTLTSISLPADSNRVAVGANAAADVNGDGLPDLLTARTDAGIYLRLNTAAGGTLSFSSPTLAYTGVGSTCSLSGNNAWRGTSARHADLNGDNRDDITVTCITGGFPTVAYSFQTLISQGSNFVAGPLFGASTGSSFMPVNWNDDQCTDIFYSGGVYIAGCNGSTPSTIGSFGLFTGAAVDWDGDGRVDVLVAPNTSSSPANLYLSQGDSATAGGATTIPGYGSGYVVFDQNGDGLDDLATFDSGSSNAVSYRLHNGSGTRPDLLTSITDGYGINFSPSYVSLPQTLGVRYFTGPLTTYPHRKVVDATYVVSQVGTSTGTGTSYTQSYEYSAGRWNLQGRGFLGFQTKYYRDNRPGSLVRGTSFHTDFPYTGMFYYENLEVPNSYDRVYHYTTTRNTLSAATLDSTPYNQRYFPAVSQSSLGLNEVGGPRSGLDSKWILSTFSYDSFGNVTNIATSVTDTDSTSPYATQVWSITQGTTVSPDTGNNWCLGLPTSTTFTYNAPGVPAITRTKQFTPDYAKCHITQEVTEPSSASYKVTRDFGFDTFGNVNSITATGINVSPARTTSLVWGGAGQFPTQLTNAAGHVTSASYNYDKGVQLTETDPNGLVTTFEYDDFARRTREIKPDGTYTSWGYSDCASLGGCLVGTHALAVTQYQYNSDNSVRADGTTYFDPLDRPLVENKRLMSGSYARNEIRYDALGRVQQRAMPCTWSSVSTSCAFWTTYGYDALNRQISETRPIKESNTAPQTGTISYQGRTVVSTDPQGKLTTKVFTVTGLLARSQDHDGYYQSFTYDAFGSLKSVTDSLSNTLFTANYDYGMEAFQTSRTDMDMGSAGFSVNAFGEITAMTDANASTFSMTYDPLSRLKTRFVAGEGTTTFTWGTSPTAFEVGQLSSIISDNGPTEIYTYDNKGRLSNRRIVSDATYDFGYTYNATTGLADTLTYPISTSGYRLKLQYAYQNGFLNQVKDFNSATVFWQANAMNVRGQITQDTLGNGLVTNRTFDAVTGLLNTIQCGLAGGTCTQNHSFLFDLVGNLTQRQNNNLGLTENFYYDNVYRLDYSQLNGSTNLDLSYDAMGNITSRSDIAGGATWTYHSTKKHAVTQAGNSSFTYSYDGNGNAVTRNGYPITWSKYNYPTQIEGNGESTSFFYNGKQERWKQVYSRGGTTETTIYAGKLLQKVTTGSTADFRHYIYANGTAVTVVSRASTGVNATRYLLRDHLGGVAKITSATGATLVSESYTAFGARRNPSTWSGSPTNGDLVTISSVTREGFTAHEAVGTFGLNHMNGRVQDSITGRFLTADPLTTDFQNTQGFNRYSYVMNNPLTYVDPTGLSCSDVIFNDGSGDGDGGSDGGSWYGGDLTCYPDLPPNLPDGPSIDPDGAPSPGAPSAGPPQEQNPTRVSTQEAPCSSDSALGETFSEDTAARRARLAARTPADDVANVAVGLGSLATSIGQEFRNSNLRTPGTLSYRGFDGRVRSFTADVSAQTRALNAEANALNVGGRVLTLAGGALAVRDISIGYQSGNDGQVFNGAYGLTATALGMLQPGVGIGMAIAAVAAPDDDTSSVFDRHPGLVSTGCRRP